MMGFHWRMCKLDLKYPSWPCTYPKLKAKNGQLRHFTLNQILYKLTHPSNVQALITLFPFHFSLLPSHFLIFPPTIPSISLSISTGNLDLGFPTTRKQNSLQAITTLKLGDLSHFLNFSFLYTTR